MMSKVLKTVALLAFATQTQAFEAACGSIGVTAGRPTFVEGGVSPKHVDLTNEPSQSAQVALAWNNNGLNVLIPQYQVKLAMDSSRSFNIDLGLVDSGNDAKSSVNIDVRAKDVCPRYCCRAMTADCLSCDAGMSKEKYCRVQEDRGISVHGCVEEPTDDTNDFCCLAFTAPCLSCQEGMTVSEYCNKVDRSAVGCDELASNSTEAVEDRRLLADTSSNLLATVDRQLADDGEGDKTFCCKALVAECLSCQEEMSLFDYCLKYPSTLNCGFIYEARIQLATPQPILGCPYTAESEPFYIRCPEEINYEWYERQEGKIGVASGAAGLAAIALGAAVVAFRRRKPLDEYSVGDGSGKMTPRRMSQLSFPSKASAQDFAAHHGKDLEEAIRLEEEMEQEKKEHHIHLPFTHHKEKAHLESENPAFDQ